MRREVWRLQMEFELSPLKEQVKLELTNQPNILRDACHQETPARPLRDLPSLLTAHQWTYPQAAGREVVALCPQVENQVLLLCCDSLRCARKSSCHTK